MKINTGIKATTKFMEIMGSVIGQMSDGIWENTRTMEKYWRSLRAYKEADGNIWIEDRVGVCTDPMDFFANKIKQIIKIEAEDNPRSGIEWSRSCSATTTYLSYYETITVGDCYELYERLKGRNATKNTYASYDTYKVEMAFSGVSFTISVEALNERDAKARALQKFEDQVACRITK